MHTNIIDYTNGYRATAGEFRTRFGAMLASHLLSRGATVRRVRTVRIGSPLHLTVTR